MQKVLIVETNVTRYGQTNDPTGLWLGEAAEFVDELQRANIEFDFVSPKGGFVPLDPRSMKYTDDEIMRIYESQDFVTRGLTNTMTPAEVHTEDYAAIYYTGGHGVMWDFPNDQPLQKKSLRQFISRVGTSLQFATASLVYSTYEMLTVNI